MDLITLETARMILRPWQEADLIPFAKINADKEVMRYYPATLSSDESNDFATRIQQRLEQNGWGFWALENKTNKQFMGFTGLNIPGYDLPCNPCIEIGWRLGRDYWGQGFATEAATACLDFAFESLNTQRIVAFTSVVNDKSRSVMERLGMKNIHQNFCHPIIPAGHELEEHVLYEVHKTDWHALRK